MDLFRHILAVPMLVTTLGLAWILGRQAGVDGMTIGLAAALLFALGLWWAGRRQAALKGGAWWPVLATLVVAAALIAAVPRDTAVAATASTGTVPFSEAKLAELRKDGKPVFLYFTADWCLTCKVNEKGVLERSEVVQAFRAHKVAVMVGDWTRGDPAIGRFIESQGRSGVPLYLYYPPGAEAQMLPQILTVNEVTSRL